MYTILVYEIANGTFVVQINKLNYSPFSSIFVVLCRKYHSLSGIFWDFDGNYLRSFVPSYVCTFGTYECEGTYVDYFEGIS